MRRLVSMTVVAAGLAAASAARADGALAVELGLRTGYALPLGNASGAQSFTVTSNGSSTTTSGPGASLSDEVSGQIPVWVDAGLRVGRSAYVGAFLQYGFGFVGSSGPNAGCDRSGFSCSVHDIAYGLEAHYHLAPEGPFDPWVGLGAGRESVTLSLSANGQSASGTLSGWQFVDFQLGGDYLVTPSFGIGPFAVLSLGQYDSFSLSEPGVDQSSDITNKTLHEWLTLGVRGVYDLSVM